MTGSTDLKKIADRIEELGLKKQHVAAKAGISVGHFSYVLSGQRQLNDELKEKLFEILDWE